jgi:2-haloacid dehalogenase
VTGALAFDVFGTLVEPFGSVETLAGRLEHPDQLVASWRRHQLEISWLLSLMGRYESWPAVTGYALDVALEEAGVSLTVEEKRRLLDEGNQPRLFPDVAESLADLVSAGFRLAVLSNGMPDSLRSIVESTGIAHWFGSIISADEVAVFKPAPVVYQHAARRLGCTPDQLWLVSANPFDCAGARSAGLRVAKIERRPSFSYPFVRPPDVVVADLRELAPRIPPA